MIIKINISTQEWRNLGGKSISIQVKAREVHILPFEERKPLLDYKENDEEEEDDYEKFDKLLE